MVKIHTNNILKLCEKVPAEFLIGILCMYVCVYTYACMCVDVQVFEKAKMDNPEKCFLYYMCHTYDLLQLSGRNLCVKLNDTKLHLISSGL